jgi:DNA-binding NarL/FixJ family response regulator
MNSSHAILICDREPFFREALVNLLLSAGYSRVEVVTTAREALRRLRRQNYSHVLIGIASSPLRSRRLARIAQQRQPRAKIIFLVRVQERDAVNAQGFDCIIKEQAFVSLLQAMAETRQQNLTKL